MGIEPNDCDERIVVGRGKRLQMSLSKPRIGLSARDSVPSAEQSLKSYVSVSDSKKLQRAAMLTEVREGRKNRVGPGYEKRGDKISRLEILANTNNWIYPLTELCDDRPASELTGMSSEGGYQRCLAFNLLR